jgi:hypothetical protein
MNDTQLVLDVWEAVRDALPAAKRGDCAQSLLRAFADYGFEGREISGIIDEDGDLETAYYDIFHDGETPDGPDEAEE